MKLLFLDIETSPSVADVWGLWNQNVGLAQLRESSFMMSFAAKWQHQKSTQFYSYYHDGQESMIKRANELMSEADAICHYNGNKFDIPTLHKELALAGMMPPAPSRQIDLYTVVKKQFRFPSYKLDYVSKAFGLPGKEKHSGHELWVKCLAEDAKAWAKMKKYNIQDVILTEQLYDKILPWITNHPNRTLYDVGVSCPNCGTSTELQRRGFSYIRTGKYQRYQCTICGTWTQDPRRAAGSTITGVSY